MKRRRVQLTHFISRQSARDAREGVREVERLKVLKADEFGATK